jgi:iron complex outermembrane receptor protein
MTNDTLYRSENQKESRAGFALSALLIVGGAMLFPQQRAMAQGAGETGAQRVLEEVVVTARRREESLQSVPTSVVSLNAGQLEKRNISELTDMGSFIPNLVTTGNLGTSAAVIFIRGVGQAGNAINAQRSVGIYVDGVFIGSADGALLDVVDMERIEVLRGPQGTLFGKNNTGGAIQFITTKPGEEFGGDFSATYGRFDRIDVKGNVNIPLSDELFLRLSAASLNRDGHVTSVIDGQDYGDKGTTFIRGALRWQPGPDLTVDLAADFTNIDTNGAAHIQIRNGEAGISGPGLSHPPDTLSRVADFEADTGIDVTEDRVFLGFSHNGIPPTDGQRLKQEVWGFNLTMDWKASDWLSVKSISAYRTYNWRRIEDQDGTEFLIFNEDSIRDYEQFTQELQFLGSVFNNRIDYIFGGFYFHEVPKEDRFRKEAARALSFAVFEDEVDQIAAFGEVTFHFTDVFSVFAGGRYTHEERDTVSLSDRDADGPRAPISGSGSGSYNAFTPRVGLQAQWTQDLMTYVTYATGFRGGGVNNRVNANLPNNGFVPFNEEAMDMVEVGVKSQWLNNRLRFNAAFALSTISDLQLRGRDPITLETFTSNVGETKFDVVEMEAIFFATDHLRLEASGAWLDARYTDLGGAEEDITLDSRPERAPEFSYTLAAEYSRPLRNGGGITARVDWGWKDDLRFTDSEASHMIQDSMGLLSARLTYEPPDSRWQASVFGTNLTDQKYLTGTTATSGARLARISAARPAEWGIQWKLYF